MFKQYRKDLTYKGVINTVIYISAIVFIQYLLQFKTTAFEGFNKWHHIIWYIILIAQNIYILVILYNPEKFAKERMGKNLYNFFTKGGYDSFLDILIVSEKEPLMEYIYLFIFIMIPWPMFKDMTWKKRILLIFSKIGVFHLVTSLLLMNWKTDKVELDYYNK